VPAHGAALSGADLALVQAEPSEFAGQLIRDVNSQGFQSGVERQNRLNQLPSADSGGIRQILVIRNRNVASAQYPGHNSADEDVIDVPAKRRRREHGSRSH
jgi:hypothetical protein